ncbi:MAG: HupE/UreJ family protein, partial [Bacteroidia bacterium]
MFPIFHLPINQFLENLQTYFFVGWHHLMNFSSWDHWMFLIILMLPFEFQDWKKWLSAVSLFTLGHTITLFLCAFFPDSFRFSWIETGIILTILFSALGNVFQWS